MSYIVTRSFYEGDTLHQEGAAFSHTDSAYIEKCLTDGNIAASDGTPQAEAVTTETSPLVEAPSQAEVLTVQNEQVQPSAETISEDLTVAESGSSVQPTNLNIQ